MAGLHHDQLANRRCAPRLALGLALATTLALCPSAAPGQAPPAPAEPLAQSQSRLAERYDRLEVLAARLAEVSQSAQPERAKLLNELVKQGRERDVPGQFDRVGADLAEQRYSAALEGGAALQGDLEKLLELLLEEDRDRQIDSERKRIARYLQELNRVLRLQRGVKARTEGGDQQRALADDQTRVGDETRALEDKIKKNERLEEAKKPGAQPAGQPPSPGESEQKPGEPTEKSPAPSDGSPSGEPRDAQDPKRPGETPQPSPGSPPGDSQQSPKGAPAEGAPAAGSPSDGQPSESPPESPVEKAVKRLQRAQRRMQEAQRQLEEAKRAGAAQDQQRAIEDLEQARAELERILRQLREEEVERMLVLLEARLRKMLDEQNEIYDRTKGLEKTAETLAEHELEIAAARLSRRERQIVVDADRALVLLREDGTSLAFPEALEQAREDMQTIADRLNETRVDKLTQTYEEDVIAALEETLGALRQAIEKMRKQRSSGQPSSGEPGEQPLVDQLAELRMIRSLQLRVNRRTKVFAEAIGNQPVPSPEVLEALDELAQRQENIYRATRDLHAKDNQ